MGATLASNIIRFSRDNGGWGAETVVDVESVELEGWPLPGGVPGLITDIVLSMDDRFLYLSNWLHGDLRQYDVSDPRQPKLTGQLWLGGLLGKPNDAGRDLNGGPQMIQLSLDGRRLYVTNSLYSSWDNQFYPELRSWLLKVNCRPEGGMEVDRDFFVDFHARAGGRRTPTRCGCKGATARPRSSNDCLRGEEGERKEGRGEGGGKRGEGGGGERGRGEKRGEGGGARRLGDAEHSVRKPIGRGEDDADGRRAQ